MFNFLKKRKDSIEEEISVEDISEPSDVSLSVEIPEGPEERGFVEAENIKSRLEVIEDSYKSDLADVRIRARNKVIDEGVEESLKKLVYGEQVALEWELFSNDGSFRKFVNLGYGEFVTQYSLRYVEKGEDELLNLKGKLRDPKKGLDDPEYSEDDENYMLFRSHFKSLEEKYPNLRVWVTSEYPHVPGGEYEYTIHVSPLGKGEKFLDALIVGIRNQLSL